MSRRLVSSLLGALVCFAGGLNGFTAGVADSLSEEVRTVFSRCRDAVVKIEAVDRDGMLRGTGFFIDPNGTLLTSFSVGGESRDIFIVQGERKLPAHRLTGDPRSGVAVLQLDKIETPTPFLSFGKSADLAVATAVLSIAYPMDLPVTPNFGMVAGFNSKYQDRYFALMHIRANVPVHRGEGGAPLLNMRGEAVGVVISGLEGGVSCFALPIEAAAKVHRDYVRFGGTHPGRLGVVLREAVKAVQGSTVVVLRLEENSPASLAGIQKGDVLMAIGNHPVDRDGNYLLERYGKVSVAHLLACEHFDGDKVSFKLARQGKELSVEVKLAHADPAQSIIEPYTLDKAPRYTIVGGLVFQELSRQFLKEWGPEWTKKAPERFLYFDQYQDELFKNDPRQRIVIMSNVLPSPCTVGYEDLNCLVVTKVNGVELKSLADMDAALAKPIDGFHRIQIQGHPGEIVLDAKEAAAIEPALMRNSGLQAIKRL